MEEPLLPSTLDPPIPPLEDVAPPPSTVPMLLVPPTDPTLTPPAMAHFALVETAHLLNTTSMSPLLGHVVASVPSPT
jgi:hypothetical protein